MNKTEKIQIGESLTADFEENSWTFEMNEDVVISAGTFAIVDITNISEDNKAKLFDFIENL